MRKAFAMTRNIPRMIVLAVGIACLTMSIPPAWADDIEYFVPTVVEPTLTSDGVSVDAYALALASGDTCQPSSQVPWHAHITGADDATSRIVWEFHYDIVVSTDCVNTPTVDSWSAYATAVDSADGWSYKGVIDQDTFVNTVYVDGRGHFETASYARGRFDYNPVSGKVTVPVTVPPSVYHYLIVLCQTGNVCPVPETNYPQITWHIAPNGKATASMTNETSFVVPPE